MPCAPCACSWLLIHPGRIVRIEYPGHRESPFLFIGKGALRFRGPPGSVLVFDHFVKKTKDLSKQMDHKDSFIVSEFECLSEESKKHFLLLDCFTNSQTGFLFIRVHSGEERFIWVFQFLFFLWSFEPDKREKQNKPKGSSLEPYYFPAYNDDCLINEQ